MNFLKPCYLHCRYVIMVVAHKTTRERQTREGEKTLKSENLGEFNNVFIILF